MKAIIQYQADDGSLWPTADQAAHREALQARCDGVNVLLPSVPLLGDHVQHDPEQVLAFHRAVVALAREYTPDDGFWATVARKRVADEEVHPASAIGQRLREEDALAPLYRLWSRRYRIDGEGREWSEPYYVIEADKRTNFR